MKKHQYSQTITWTGNTGNGTANYSAYERDFVIETEGKPAIKGSSDPAFRGDSSRYNPEELLVAAISSCHMLWYLHLCAQSSINVIAYKDQAKGTLIETKDGSGQFSEITLYPIVSISNADMTEKAIELHQKAHKLCFIAKSVNFPIYHSPIIIVD